MQIITKTNRKLKSKFQSILKHKGFKEFIVLSRSRTGSNMLISFLNSHPHIQAEGEIFAKLGSKDPNDILSEVFAKQPLYVKARGFKIFYYHPLDEKDKSNELWNALINMNNLQVIHLKRRNLLRTLVSRKIAILQDVWAVRDYDQSGIEERSELC
jgi:LPS sulfotransferase NodH